VGDFLYPLANFITILDYVMLEKIANLGIADQHLQNITNELADLAKDIGIPTKEKTILK